MTRKKIKNPEISDNGKNWNVVTGCDKYSDGCMNCYSKDGAKWQKSMGNDVYVQNGFNHILYYDPCPIVNHSKGL